MSVRRAAIPLAVALLTCGATVLGMDVVVPSQAVVGRNCIVYPQSGAHELGGGAIPSGATVRTSGY